MSGHPNHGAVFAGVSRLMEQKLVSDVEVLSLASVNILRKYIAIADVNFTWVDEWQAFGLNPFESYRVLALHVTQMVWFRKLFIIFSRYTYVNSFYRYVQ